MGLILHGIEDLQCNTLKICCAFVHGYGMYGFIVISKNVHMLHSIIHHVQLFNFMLNKEFSSFLGILCPSLFIQDQPSSNPFQIISCELSISKFPNGIFDKEENNSALFHQTQNLCLIIIWLIFTFFHFFLSFVYPLFLNLFSFFNMKILNALWLYLFLLIPCVKI